MPACKCDAPAALQWAHTAFGDCVQSRLAGASLAFGLVAIVASFVTQAPQVVTNFRAGSAAALSPTLLVGWLLGDCCNLTGALLARQLPTQIASSSVLLLLDCVLLAQYVGYSALARRRRAAAAREMQHCARGVLLAAPACAAVAAAEASSSAARPRCSTQLRLVPWQDGARARVGYALGCVSATTFLVGLCTQVAKNRRRRSVEGLSLLMIGTALVMNTAYALSVLLRVRSGVDVAASAPWVVGSAGAAVLDVVILAQGRHYGSWRKQPRAAGQRSATVAPDEAASNLL